MQHHGIYHMYVAFQILFSFYNVRTKQTLENYNWHDLRETHWKKEFLCGFTTPRRSHAFYYEPQVFATYRCGFTRMNGKVGQPTRKNAFGPP